ncbi:MAG: hypothetical protein M1837_002683 [Sclerophora amabilis]|nr:MAG: hypothetical protein M1837_002683 [Sclerophora amabilis]
MFTTLQCAPEKSLVAIEASTSLPPLGKNQHVVCQQCRDKKLKCSGYTTEACDRCKAQRLECTAGKSTRSSLPRKRRRRKHDDQNPSRPQSNTTTTTQPLQPSLHPAHQNAASDNGSPPTPYSTPSDSHWPLASAHGVKTDAQNTLLSPHQTQASSGTTESEPPSSCFEDSFSAKGRTGTPLSPPYDASYGDILDFDLNIDHLGVLDAGIPAGLPPLPSLQMESAIMDSLCTSTNDYHDDNDEDEMDDDSDEYTRFLKRVDTGSSTTQEDNDSFIDRHTIDSSSSEHPSTSASPTGQSMSCTCMESALALLEKIRIQENPLPSADASSAAVAMHRLYIFKRFVLHFQGLVACPHCSCASPFMTLLVLLSEQLASTLQGALTAAAADDGGDDATSLTVISCAYLVDLPTERHAMFATLALLHVQLLRKTVVALHARASTAQWKSHLVSLRRRENHLQAMESALQAGLAGGCAVQPTSIE